MGIRSTITSPTPSQGSGLRPSPRTPGDPPTQAAWPSRAPARAIVGRRPSHRGYTKAADHHSPGTESVALPVLDSTDSLRRLPAPQSSARSPEPAAADGSDVALSGERIDPLIRTSRRAR